jgi:K+-transporting ATPase ATPase C chain
MKEIFRALVAVLAFTVVLGFGYTFLVTLAGAWLWPDQAEGSLVEFDGRLVGSTLLAQPFVSPQYFWPRPSASGFNADAQLEPTARALSYPSNLGPTNPELAEAITQRVELYGEGVPVDLVTGSGSSLDPHISLAAALWQVSRVADARGIDETVVRHLVDENIETWLGRRYVNVLLLNIALDDFES